MSARIFFLFLMSFPALVAQERIQRERTFGEPVFIETHQFSTENDSVRIEIFSRLRKDLFIYSRDAENTSTDFVAHGSVVVEILDSTGSSVARNIRELTMTSADNSIQFLRTQHTQIISTFYLLPGRYSAIIQIEDTDSKRHHPDIRNPLVVKSFTTTFHSDFIPVCTQKDSNRYECFNLGGDVLFSQDFGLAMVLHGRMNNRMVHYSLQRFSTEDEEIKEPVVIQTGVTATVFPGLTIQFQENNEAVTLAMVPDDNNSTLIVPISGMQLKQGRYELTVTLPDSSKDSIQFKSRWLDMPMSLTDLDMATLPLQYITTEDDYSNLRSGGRKSRIEKFEAFWKKKDPTPETAYNEMMAEFYKRVDIATVAYRTLKEINGSMTDRGKIFILYGSPTTTDRILKPGDIPKEVWKYSSLNKKFVFEDPSKQGNYKLTESK